MIFAIAGLALIHFDQMALGKQAVLGVLVMIFACVLWAFSAVYVKKLAADISPVRLGTGSVVVALPFLLITWYFLDGQIPNHLTTKSVLAVAYLVVVGSVMSHILWFYVLRECNVNIVALVPLLTPVLAITWGILFGGEQLTPHTLFGGGVILFSLALYQGVIGKIFHAVLNTNEIRVAKN